MSCIFCEIINKKSKQAKNLVYQDKKVSAFMDHLQPHPGHVLIVPNSHIINIFEIDEKLAAHMFKITTKMAKAVKEVFKPHGVDIYQCNGKCAGQSVFHMHIHVFPREPEDGYFRIYPEHIPKIEDTKTLNKYKKELQKHI